MATSEALGLQKAAATGVLSKLSRHVVYTARDIVRKKRDLEQELWGGTNTCQKVRLWPGPRNRLL
jgi:hypothetical protein